MRSGRPQRLAELQEVARRADASVESVRAFFFRPGRLSAALRQRIADAVAETGYRPSTSTKRGLAGVRIGYQLPRVLAGSTVSPVQLEQFQQLVVATQRAGGVLVPFVVDPPVLGDVDVRGGTALERSSPELGTAAWLRTYAHALAPATYRDVLSAQQVSAFVINDPQVDDARIAAMAEEGITVVSLARAFFRRPDGTLELDPQASFVASDYAAGVAALVHSLREAGCVRLAHARFADDGSVIPFVRRAAVQAALGDAPVHQVHYELSSTDDPTLDTFLRTHRPHGVVSDSDELADLVWRSAERVGLEPGRQPGEGRIVVTGVDDAPIRRRHPVGQRWPSMALDYPAFMAAVVDVLIARRNGDRTPAQRYVPPVLIGALGRDPEERTAPAAVLGDLDPPV